MRKITRRWRISWRDTLLLLREFRTPLLVFLITLLIAGFSYYAISTWVNEPVGGVVESVYLVLTMAFLQASVDFPVHPLLQAFFFIMPLVGVGLLAQGLADFGYLFFNRRSRSKEWEMAVASTISEHVILVGLGHLGYRVAAELHALNESVVVIELNPSADLFTAVQKMGIPVIQDDATRPTALEAAGITRARTIVLCSQNDAMNLKIAVKARSLNPSIQVVVRIFDDDFADSLQAQFGFIALSATAMAAPSFAAAAAGVDITNPIHVEGSSLSLARLKVSRHSLLIGKNVGEVEQVYDLSIVFIKHDGDLDMHPASVRSLLVGDLVGMLGAPERLTTIVHDNK